VWNQKVFFWANGPTQQGYSVAVNVFDDDALSADDPLGQVQVPIEQKAFDSNVSEHSIIRLSRVCPRHVIL